METKVVIWWLYIFILILLPVLECLEDARDYVVLTDYCRVPNPNPFTRDVMRNFHRVKYKPCTTLLPLTRVEYNESSESYDLSVNETMFERYLKIDLELSEPVPANLSCCYMGVKRCSEQAVELQECQSFEQSVQLPNSYDGFIVQCHANGKLIYTNGHATVPERPELRHRLKQWETADSQRAPSVLVIGIDSISRLNLIRAMPETYNYLVDSGWFEMSGYNKVGDNTFVNLMALLTGKNLSSVMEQCNPQEVAGLDKCEFIWKLFESLGYVTAFGEDDVPINTFNYQKQGFQKPPVDYYMRPYLIAAEQWLDKSSQEELEDQICLGYEHASEHVYNFALEFARRYQNDSFFGFFWTNTHSHGPRISRTSAMDHYMHTYLEKLVEQGTMEHTVVLFLSDHGNRLGPTRHSTLGWLEDRQPFLFVSFPEYLKQAYPEFVESLEVNRNRLTAPYDVYATLKHILEFARSGNILDSEGVVKDYTRGQSLIQPVPLNRSCADVSISYHWCTCWSYSKYYNFKPTDIQMAHKAVQYINDQVLIRNNGKFKHICKPLTLHRIRKAFEAQLNSADDPRVSIHLLQLTTLPNHGIYDVTVRYNSSNGEMLADDFSRMDNFDGPFCL